LQEKPEAGKEDARVEGLNALNPERKRVVKEGE